jgi:hypothetical protein
MITTSTTSQKWGKKMKIKCMGADSAPAMG